MSIGAWVREDGLEGWSTEDIDVNHVRMSKDSVSEMDKELLDQINSTVHANDVLYHLGDFVLAGKTDAYNHYKRYRDQIRCKNVHLIWGNHDVETRDIAGLFNSANHLSQVRVGSLEFVLCHYAMATWNKSHRGVMQLYGHSHAGAEGWLSEAMPERRNMDVGVDNAALLLGRFRPFSVDEIVGLIGHRKGQKHH